MAFSTTAAGYLGTSPITSAPAGVVSSFNIFDIVPPGALPPVPGVPPVSGPPPAPGLPPVPGVPPVSEPPPVPRAPSGRNARRNDGFCPSPWATRSTQLTRLAQQRPQSAVPAEPHGVVPGVDGVHVAGGQVLRLPVGVGHERLVDVHDGDVLAR